MNDNLKDIENLMNDINDIKDISIMKITKEQLISKLRECEVSEGNFAYEDYDEDKLDFGKITEIEQIGGEEEGSNWFSIKYFEKTKQYFKISGYYQSYSGTDFEGYESCLKEVFPKEKTITVYE